jgi:hypothetical protein
MARTQKWTFVVGLLVGAAAASVFWFHNPYLQRQLAQQTAAEAKVRQSLLEAKEGPDSLERFVSPASGLRYQTVTDGKQVFLADLQEGRVWRYFHLTQEGGSNKEDEGFLPLALYFAGKKHYSAAEVEPVPGAAPPRPQPREKPAP